MLLAVLLALAALGAVGTLVGTQAASLSSGAPPYTQTIQNKVDAAKAYRSYKQLR